jgi:hypothetical protein
MPLQDIFKSFKESTFATEASNAAARLYSDASHAANRLYADVSTSATRFAEDASEKVDRIYTDASQVGAGIAGKASESASKFAVDTATEVAQRVTKQMTEAFLAQAGGMFQAPSSTGDAENAPNQMAPFMKALGLLLLAIFMPFFNQAPAAHTKAAPDDATKPAPAASPGM